MHKPRVLLVTGAAKLVALIVMAAVIAPPYASAFAQCGVENITVEITYDHVESENADPPLNAPDPYLYMAMYPSNATCQYSMQTRTQNSQGTCSNVFRVPPLRTFYTFCNMHASSYRRLSWAVWDDDGSSSSDELMTKGWAYLPPGTSWQGSASRDFYISFKSLNPTANCYLLSRTLPSSPGINAPIVVGLDIGFPTGPVNLEEHIPDGFIYEGASIPESSVTPIVGGSEDGGGTLVRWDSLTPPVAFTYNLTTPGSQEQLGLPFGNHLDSGTNRYYAAIPLAEIAIGGVVTDCNGDNEDDNLQIELGSLPDCNGNEILDQCDIASGGSEDADMNGIPDECDVPTGALVAPAPSYKDARIRAWPNPFNPGTTIEFEVPNAGPVRIDIYNAAGRYVTTLVKREFQAGRHTVIWRGTDHDGKRVPTGVYHARFSTSSTSTETKLVLLK